MPVCLREVAAAEVAVALQQTRLVGNQRLADAIYVDPFGCTRPLERIPRPDDKVSAASGRKASDLPAHADRFGWP